MNSVAGGYKVTTRDGILSNVMLSPQFCTVTGKFTCPGAVGWVGAAGFVDDPAVC
jgi:hypothetical protein